MMSRGNSLPVLSGRKPVSISCEISVLISMISPRLALAGTLMRARAISDSLEAGGKRHDDLELVGPERAVAHLRDGGDLLRIREADARRDAGAAGARSEMDAHHVRLRVLFREDVNGLDVVGRGHRALGRDREG